MIPRLRLGHSKLRVREKLFIKRRDVRRIDLVIRHRVNAIQSVRDGLLIAFPLMFSLEPH